MSSSTMEFGLVDRVARGLQAVALARKAGRQTQEWEERLQVLIDDLDREPGELFAWARTLTKDPSRHQAPIQYYETPLRQVTTARIAENTAHYLDVVRLAESIGSTGGWGIFDAAWWHQRRLEALAALASLRFALEHQR